MWQAFDPFRSGSEPFLELYLGAAAVAAIASWLLRDIFRTTERRPDLRDLDAIDYALCTGGSGRAADTLYLLLAERGSARLCGRSIVVEPDVSIPERLADLAAAVAGRHRLDAFRASVVAGPGLVARRTALRRRRVLLDAGRSRRCLAATLAPIAALLALGLARTAFDAWHGAAFAEPLMLSAAALFALLLTWDAERGLTGEAAATLAAIRRSSSASLRHPAPEDIAFAFAMIGPVALVGTDQAAFALLLRRWPCRDRPAPTSGERPSRIGDHPES